MYNVKLLCYVTVLTFTCTCIEISKYNNTNIQKTLILCYLILCYDPTPVLSVCGMEVRFILMTAQGAECFRVHLTGLVIYDLMGWPVWKKNNHSLEER